MSHTFLLYHIVIATKERRPVLTASVERRVYAILYHILTKSECYVYRINGMPDHIHLLIDAPCTIAPSRLVGELKRQSSMVINSDKVIESWPGWSQGYYLETLSRSAIGAVKQYIIQQKVHHLHHSFLEEYRDMLVAQGLPPDIPSIVALEATLRQEIR